ncbi:MAG: AMP-binding protein, partial [Cyanobacteria bacterium J06632_3]
LMFFPKTNEIFTAPLNEDSVEACRKTSCGIKKANIHLNRTLPSLLDEGCQFSQFKQESLLASIHHYSKGEWQSWTIIELRRMAEELAIALQQHPNIKKGDRAALLMDSNVPFVVADIGCLLAQLVTVPISPTQPVKTTEYMLAETEASVLIVSHLQQIKKLLQNVSSLTSLKLILVADEASENRSDTPFRRSLDQMQWALPETVDLMTLTAFRKSVSWSEPKAQALTKQLNPQDLATIVYTLSDQGRPLGAMLTHKNLSGSALAAFSTLPCLRKGPREVALSFLPLHHIFARGFVYGSLSFGQSLYFSSPRRVMKHLKELKPTVFFTVPRLLEKVYEGWQTAVFTEKNFQVQPIAKLKQIALAWAWNLASGYKLDDPQSVGYRIQLWAARQTVLRPLRNLFGGRMQCFIAGGAALPAEVMTLMSAAGLKLCHGYGLTEAGSTLSFTRRHWSKAGTVGVPMPGVELALAPDGEVMAKAPYVMQGYYRNAEATRKVLEENGWLHTGDRGHFSSEGLLTLTGNKKALFKLSIGEYVAPLPIEQALQQSPLVQRALVVGPGRKFCGLLIFPEITALNTYAQQTGMEISDAPLEEQPQVISLYQSLVDDVNASLPFWSTVKRFLLVNVARTTVNTEEQNSLAALDREILCERFAHEIAALYQPASKTMPAPKYKSQSISEVIHQLSMLIPSILSLKKERPTHV